MDTGMLIKKGEIVTFVHGPSLMAERDRPMIAVQDFDLQAIGDELTRGMDGYDRQMKVYVLHEILEDMGLMQPAPHRLVRLIADEDRFVIEHAEEDPRVTDRPVLNS